jgi:hypothetical protein
MTDRTDSPGTLAEYERFRREGRIVEGDDPATPRERIAALTRATAKADRDAREYATARLADGERVRCWTERYGTRDVADITEWDALHGNVHALKGDA